MADQGRNRRGAKRPASDFADRHAAPSASRRGVSASRRGDSAPRRFADRARASAAAAQISPRGAGAKGDVKALAMPGEAALLPATAQEQALVSQEPEALPPLTRARVSELVLYAITNDDAGMRCQASSRQYLALKLLAASDETPNPGGKGNTGRIYQVNLICMVYIFMKTCVHVCCVRSAWFCHPGRTGRAGPTALPCSISQNASRNRSTRPCSRTKAHWHNKHGDDYPAFAARILRPD